MVKNNYCRKLIFYILLTAICAGSILAAKPLISRNTGDANLIAYFNHDEGFLMDLLWYYYSGEKRDSFQYEADYGVELLYLSDFSRIILSKVFSPDAGIFVFFLRLINLFFWIASILALWRLMRHHFGYSWKVLLVLVLLAVSPAFPYLTQNSKPEPIVLFFMISGLDYSLRIIDKFSWINLFFAVICSSVAALVKYAGIFLLPVVIVAIYLSTRQPEQKNNVFPVIRTAWLSPALVGLFFNALALAVIFFYKRQSTGLSWYEQFGFLRSVSGNRLLLGLLIVGDLLIAVSIILRILKRFKDSVVNETLTEINLLLSANFFVLLAFIFSSFLLGYRWFRHPGHFIQTVATSGNEAFTGAVDIASNNIFLGYVEHCVSAMREFGLIVLLLFIVYLTAEMMSWRRNIEKDRVNLFKRILLVLFVFEGLFCMFVPMRFARHHMLPFFVAASILCVHAITMFGERHANRFWQRILINGLIFIGLFLVIMTDLKTSIDLFSYNYRWREDVVFDIARWFKANYPNNTPIVADHPTRAYLPPEFKNVKYVKYQSNKYSQFRVLIEKFRPQLLYCNTIKEESVKFTIEDGGLLGIKLEPVKTFDNAGKYYKRFPDSKYQIYKIIY